MKRSEEKGHKGPVEVSTITGCCPETLISLRAKERARGAGELARSCGGGGLGRGEGVAVLSPRFELTEGPQGALLTRGSVSEAPRKPRLCSLLSGHRAMQGNAAPAPKLGSSVIPDVSSKTPDFMIMWGWLRKW